MRMNHNFEKKTLTKKGISAIFAAASLAVLISSAAVFAAGPSFNIFPIGYSGAQNTDYPLLDARNITGGGQFSTSQAQHDTGISANPGDIIELLMYYHNGTPDAPENTAINARAKAFVPTSAALQHTISAQLTADNATTVSSAEKGGDVKIAIAGTAPQRLEYIPGSTQWFKERSTTGQAMPDDIITASGLALSDIRGCWNFAGFVRFRVKVTAEQQVQPRLEIIKQVAPQHGTTFADTIDANPSDIVTFKITVTARNGDVAGTVIRDIVPTGLIYQQNTTRVNNAAIADNTGFVAGGYEFGNLAKDQSVTVIFQAQIANASYFTHAPGTYQTLTNTSNARGTNIPTVQDTADVRVLAPQQNASFQLSKSAFNESQGVNAQSAMANAGDTINYTLTYKNTGSITANNVVIEDELADVLALADIINTGEGQMNGTKIVFPAITVPAGVSIGKTFQVRVKNIPAGLSDYVMTNIFGNQVNVNVRPPQTKGGYIAPKTGTGETAAVIFALVSTVAVWIYRRRAINPSAA